MNPFETITLWLRHTQPWDFINAVSQSTYQDPQDASLNELPQELAEVTITTSESPKVKVQRAYTIIHNHIKNNRKFWTATHADTLDSLAQRVTDVGVSLHLRYSKMEKLQLFIKELRTRHPAGGNTLKPKEFTTEDAENPITPSENQKYLGPFYQFDTSKTDHPQSKKQPEQLTRYQVHTTENKEPAQSDTQMSEAALLEEARRKLLEIQAKIHNPNSCKISGTTAHDLLKKNPNKTFIAWERSSAKGSFAILIAGAQETYVTDAARFLHLMKHYDKYKCTPAEFMAYIRRHFLTTLK